MPTTISELQNVGVVDESDTWTEEDISDLSKFSLQYAVTLYPDDEETVPMPVYLDDQILEFFTAQAELRGVDLSELLNDILREEMVQLEAQR
jgi:hypothetical protein